MKTYDITFITKDDQKEKPVKAEIEKLGGKILNVSGIGEKNFTYPIKKENKGFYTTVSFEIEPSKLLDLNKKLGLQEDILRHLIIIGKVTAAEIPTLKPVKKPKEIPAPKEEKMLEAPEEIKEIAKPKKAVKPVKKAEKVEKKPEKKVSKEVTEIEKETESEEDRLAALDKKLDELLKE
ncbi:30S ribosomal protein S6 [Candidatus Berkelbacteria bacterium RBG_13_40_8]|uniref:Small ribosomal subunit protein bS6 n=1 Tax=Candidatus Berkelbacteria bacterium RBG_13_40_8 TaxID=1797467 RepID=A0A1F5DPU4_9BACT|nr:MAG: 30S ribosomal protein S6 [Candidatus Berkelbacteria bacterium RBG_13_40_8]